MATIQDSIVAMMVLDGEDLDRLYLDPAWQGQGIGGRLVDLAKQRRPSGLTLWTFQVNEAARRFYYLVRPPTVLEAFDRLVRAWRSARARTITVLSVAELADIFRAEDALPSQWLPLLEAIPVKD